MLDALPAKLETEFALSALLPIVRDEGSVYLLDPKSGHHLSRQGTNGFSCLVDRTAWEIADFRKAGSTAPMLKRERSFARPQRTPKPVDCSGHAGRMTVSTNTDRAGMR